MTQYDNTNSGVLFRETDKKSEKAPDYKGKLNVNGKELEIAGWLRESKNGNKFLSLKVQEPRQKPDAKAAPPKVEDFDDAIPFVWAFATTITGLIAGAVYAQDMFQVWA